MQHQNQQQKQKHKRQEQQQKQQEDDQPLENSCMICNSVNKLQRCAKCRSVYYCSQAHQRLDWKRHKVDCRKITASLNDTNDNNNENVDINANQNINKQQNQYKIKHQPYKDKQSILSDRSAIDDLACNSNNNNNNNNKNNFDASSESNILNEHGEAMSSLIVNNTADELEENACSMMNTNTEQEHASHVNYFRNRMENIMRISDDCLLNATTSEQISNEDLCRNVIRDMNEYGLSVIDDFLGMDKGLAILNEVHNMYAAGVFKNGQLVSNTVAERDLRTIRGDKITWVRGTEPQCSNIGYLVNRIDSVVISANKMRGNGTLGDYKIRERSKAMIACYPGSGAHYVRHVDNPNKDGRIVTAIYYLNLNWDTKRSGGMLRIFPEQTGATADIEPKFDRIIFFWSDRRNPHEVQPAHRTRYAITVWYFDAEERETALNGCR